MDCRFVTLTSNTHSVSAPIWNYIREHNNNLVTETNFIKELKTFNAQFGMECWYLLLNIRSFRGQRRNTSVPVNRISILNKITRKCSDLDKICLQILYFLQTLGYHQNPSPDVNETNFINFIEYCINNVPYVLVESVVAMDRLGMPLNLVEKAYQKMYRGEIVILDDQKITDVAELVTTSRDLFSLRYLPLRKRLTFYKKYILPVENQFTNVYRHRVPSMITRFSMYPDGGHGELGELIGKYIGI